MNIIILFTKDRQVTLLKTLSSIQGTGYEKFIIDNSAEKQNQAEVKSICGRFARCNYLGKTEFDHFIKANNIVLSRYEFLFREPGFKGWDLGYARNFALCYARFAGAEKVLFMDDDIEVPDPELITHLFSQADNFPFTGAHIRGLVDDSIIGHIATDLGVINERMLSGGFMVFRPDQINHFFLNRYNEDWIWLFLQLKDNQYCQEGEVYQELTDPLDKYKDKIIFQEFGEIILDGILDLFRTAPWENMRSRSFWERMIKERSEYLGLLSKKSTENKNERYQEIIQYVSTGSASYSPELFTSLFEKYFSDKTLFESLYDSLR